MNFARDSLTLTKPVETESRSFLPCRAGFRPLESTMHAFLSDHADSQSGTTLESLSRRFLRSDISRFSQSPFWGDSGCYFVKTPFLVNFRWFHTSSNRR